MGKRAHTAAIQQQQHHNSHHSPTKNNRSIRKRKRNCSAAIGTSSSKAMRLHNAADSSYCNQRGDDFSHGNEDEDEAASSSSNGGAPLQSLLRDRSPGHHANNASMVFNSSVMNSTDQSSIINDSPRPVYSLRPSVVNGTILYDLKQKPWRLGCPIGKGNFGEIFLASNNITIPATREDAKYVVKIEPHSNGPLFVEIHCLINTAGRKANNDLVKYDNAIKSEFDNDEILNYSNPSLSSSSSSLNIIPENPPCGIPDYIASGSHCFGNARYRFLVLPRFDHDLHSLIKNSCVSQKCVLTLAINILTVLENLHDRGYCHNDVKAQNLMISKCKYYANKKQSYNRKQHQIAGNKMKINSINNGRTGGGGGGGGATMKIKKFCDDENYEEKQQTTDSGNSSEQEANDDDETYVDSEEDFIVKRKGNYRRHDYYDDDDEDFDDCTTTNSNNSNSMDSCKTPISKNQKRRPRTQVEYSGSNPVRSCRRPQRQNSMYEEMVNSHYLRPAKRISYSEFFDDDCLSTKGGSTNHHCERTQDNYSDDDSEEFLPKSTTKSRASASGKKSSKKLKTRASKRTTRRQEKISSSNNNNKSSNVSNGNAKPLSSYASHSNDSESSEQKILKEAEHIFLIDFGLASKYMERGAHRPFIMDQRRAHDGTLEFTSRDAHMGAHSRRSDLECLGYNLLFWSQGYLPWKEAANQQQQEKVHRIKEYLMANVREMLKLVYGKDVPKYLGEFLHLISKLAYNERPNYEQYRRLFEREYQLLGYSLNEMQLSSEELKNTSIRIKKDSIESKCDIFSMYNNNGLNLSVNGTPFQDRSFTDRVSPKNLRSKTDKKAAKKKKFSWAEILSQDPDQIARERAEKEFDREEETSGLQLPARRYEGKPTYAILALEHRLRLKHEQTNLDDEIGQQQNQDEDEDEDMEVEDNEMDDDAESVQDNDDEEEQEQEDDDSDNESDDDDDDDDGNDDDDGDDSQEEEDVNSVEQNESDMDAEDSEESESTSNHEIEENSNSNSNFRLRTRDVSFDEGVRRSKRSTKRNPVTSFGRKAVKRSKTSTKKSAAVRKRTTTKSMNNSAGHSENDADDDTTNWVAEKCQNSRKAKSRKTKASGKTRTSTTSTKSSAAAITTQQANGANNGNLSNGHHHHNGKRGGATNNANKDTNSTITQQQQQQHTNTRSVSRKFGSTRQQQSNQAASAAGEVEQNTETRHKSSRGVFESNLHYSRAITNENKAPAVRERRTRRGIHKTDMELMDVDDSSNSNFSPDMRTIYNVWKKINTESIYYTASAITTGRHSARK